MRALLVAVAVVVLVLPSAARAATVAIDTGADALVVRAGPGEANRMSVAVDPSAKGVTVTDTGAAPTPGTGCRLAAPATVRCVAVDELTTERVRLGDRDDTLRFRASQGEDVDVRGEAGNDVLDLSGSRGVLLGVGDPGQSADGGPGADRLIGGRGADLLIGGAGHDDLGGGAGPDTLRGDGSEIRPTRGVSSDRLDGGAGRDTVSYADHVAGVTVDLAHPGSAGARGEHDRLRSIENVIGGPAHDVLRGNRGANRLQGDTLNEEADRPSRGGDVFVGRGGADVLVDVGEGVSRFDGGPGNDRLTEGFTAAARIACGSGTDTIDSPAGAFIPRDCERVGDDVFPFSQFIRRGSGVVVRAQPGEQYGHGCDAGDGRVHASTLTLSGPRGVRYGTLADVRKPGLYRVALTPAGRRAAAAHARLRVSSLDLCSGSVGGWRASF